MKKLGRPTNNPRPNKISIRISDGDKKILETYCEENGVNKTRQLAVGLECWKKNKSNRFLSQSTQLLLLTSPRSVKPKRDLLNLIIALPFWKFK